MEARVYPRGVGGRRLGGDKGGGVLIVGGKKKRHNVRPLRRVQQGGQQLHEDESGGQLTGWVGLEDFWHTRLDGKIRFGVLLQKVFGQPLWMLEGGNDLGWGKLLRKINAKFSLRRTNFSNVKVEGFISLGKKNEKLQTRVRTH